jgi:hypothetical protein
MALNQWYRSPDHYAAVGKRATAATVIEIVDETTQI